MVVTFVFSKPHTYVGAINRAVMASGLSATYDLLAWVSLATAVANSSSVKRKDQCWSQDMVKLLEETKEPLGSKLTMQVLQTTAKREFCFYTEWGRKPLDSLNRGMIIGHLLLKDDLLICWIQIRGDRFEWRKTGRRLLKQFWSRFGLGLQSGNDKKCLYSGFFTGHEYCCWWVRSVVWE